VMACGDVECKRHFVVGWLRFSGTFNTN